MDMLTVLILAIIPQCISNHIKSSTYIKSSYILTCTLNIYNLTIWVNYFSVELEKNFKYCVMPLKFVKKLGFLPYWIISILTKGKENKEQDQNKVTQKTKSTCKWFRMQKQSNF